MVAISQLIATVCISQPKLDTCAASQIERKVGFSSGANVADETEAASARATLLIGPSLSFRVKVALKFSPWRTCLWRVAGSGHYRRVAEVIFDASYRAETETLLLENGCSSNSRTALAGQSWFCRNL
ncbi:hypothetical protein BQ8482_130062 [Mesorhizobium delmotii]|uniref:Uncharacterized protein n=1 Tax=Mesorhizobium delmotii TaxID=1631247 RepID=A0A2P9AG92_9HYPH|nr:hypothetical protein BQ8482_130062 [Mesorhizobium delmotii]